MAVVDRLNPANGTYLNEFRMNEKVGISFTKSNDCDNNAYNLFNPEMGQLYVGWTKPGEWLKYTVDVRYSSIYVIGIMYTANGDGTYLFLQIIIKLKGIFLFHLPIKRRYRSLETMAPLEQIGFHRGNSF